MNGKILIVDDEQSMCDVLEIMLSKEDYHVTTTIKPTEGLQLVKDNHFDLVITDIRMQEMDGITLLKKIRNINSDIDVIMITAYASLNSAIEALREGAIDYITKPFEIDVVKKAVGRILENRCLKEENIILKKQLEEQVEFDEIIGSSNEITKVKDMVKRIAPTDSTVLITGESGTGKELIARAIHRLSPRHSEPFISINCGALPENLLESEIFGHKKGSFTGATHDKDGLMKVADGGTFFLDEVAETSLPLQVKLLRALEEREITPVGATNSIKVDVRLIAATNANLKQLTDDKQFRQDLYYRLNVLPIHLPPLRDRRDDILPIAHYFIKKLAEKREIETPEITKAAEDILKKPQWQGNVRELQNVIERAIVLSHSGKIDIDSLPDRLKGTGQEKSISEKTVEGVDASDDQGLLLPMKIIEKAYIYWILEQTDWNKSKTAEILQINPSTLYRKLKRYNITDK